MQQLELIMEPNTLRGALAHLIANGLECTFWTRKMHADHARYLNEKIGGNLPLLEVNYARVRAYYESEKRRGISRETIRKRLSTLHMALKEAERMDWIQKMPPWPVIKSDSRRKEDYWTETQWEAANLACEDEDFRTWIAIGFWCGSHTSDIYRFRWCDIDFVANTWMRRNTKSKATPVALPLPPRLRELLWERHQLEQPHPRDLVCGRDMGHPNRAIKELALRCGVPVIRPIGLRHSCTTHLKTKGCDDHFRSHWIGHKSVKVTNSIYTHLTDEKIAEEMAKVNTRK